MTPAGHLAFRLALEGCVQHLRKVCEAHQGLLEVGYVRTFAKPAGRVRVQLTVKRQPRKAKP